MTGARIATLDVVRGVAVMGIFSVNVVAFAMPLQAYYNPAAYGGTHGANLLVWAANVVLIDGKMRGLFTLLFGASMLLVAERAEAAGRSPALVHVSRMAWLLVFGLVHCYLIWSGDILTLYAMVGMVAFWLRKAPVRLLVLIGLGALVWDMAGMAGFAAQAAAAEAAARAPGAAAGAVAAWRDAASFLLPPDPAALAADLALHRGTYAGLVGDRLHDGLLGPLYQLQFVGIETLGSMLLGMAALKTGFLAGRWRARTYGWIAALGLALGWSGYAWLAWRSWSAGFDPATLAADSFAFTPPFRLTAMFGTAALIILLARHGGPLAQRIGAAGRMAFSNYLGTSLVAAAFFYRGALYGHFGRAEAWLVVPLVWAAILLWSKPWLDHFRYGPLEWAWRSLARWRLQPMRRGVGQD